MGKRLDARRASQDYDGCVAYSRQNGWPVTNGGNHAIAEARNGKIAVYPRHRGQYAKGTAGSIRRMWAAMLAVGMTVAIVIGARYALTLL